MQTSSKSKISRFLFLLSIVSCLLLAGVGQVVLAQPANNSVKMNPSKLVSNNLLKQLIKQNRKALGKPAKKPDEFEVQIIFTQIDRDENNVPRFTPHHFRSDSSQYFYPASTVKMPTAFMALEKLNELNIIGLDKDTPLKIGAKRVGQTAVEGDSTSATGEASIAHYIKKLFVVSDNDAHNRLYEFLGQQTLNEGLQQKGYTNSRIIHRLGYAIPSETYDSSPHHYTNPFSFHKNGELVYHQGEVFSKANWDFDLQKERKGVGFLTNDGELINEPMDFTTKNFVALQDYQDMMQAVFFPKSVAPHQRFNFTPEDYDFVYRCMSTLPTECAYPNYKANPDYYDGYVKFFLYGDTKADIPDNIRIFNKVGFAYGYLTDIAYIVDFETGVEFFLCATISVNKNQIYNDGKYEYDEIGLPFLAKLGQVIYDYEQQRPREYEADLGRFDFRE